METSAPDLEGRTFVPWWAGPLAFVTMLVSLTACGFGLALFCLVAYAFIGEDARALVLMLAVVVTFACGVACAKSAAGLLNPERWRSRCLRSGRCPRCRYTIRGLPQQRCPECGETW